MKGGYVEILIRGFYIFDFGIFLFFIFNLFKNFSLFVCLVELV